jgi:2-keto-4-pentenoate hydratase/2-oxohepta-3-ene-1,7-dioic acid hydratase in catechol pathway
VTLFENQVKMKIIRFTHEKDEPQYGWILEDQVGLLSAPPFGAYRRLDAVIPLSEVKLLAPVTPSKILAVGRNYPEHAKEHEVEIPETPMIFMKPPSAVICDGQPIVLPPQSQQVEHEAELAVVIGRRGRWIHLEDTADYILGYTVANDVTARDLQNRDGQWTRAKGFDTFCPLGPWIETEVDPSDLLVTCRVNGEIRQMSSTREMVFSVPQLIVYASSVMTLEPGDLILTGTPAGVSPLSAGDMVEVEVEGIGKLNNPVKAMEGVS